MPKVDGWAGDGDMTIKAKTLEALGRMEPEAANAAARKIVRHHNGYEFGIDHFKFPDGTEVVYVNSGDTWDSTLLSVGGKWAWSSYADVVEALPSTAGVTGATRCRYCGGWRKWEHEGRIRYIFPDCTECFPNA